MYAGIDVGGTNLKAGVVEEDGRLLAAVSMPLGEYQGAEDFADRLAGLVETAAQKAGRPLTELQGVGIGIPGAVRDGQIAYTCNLPLENIPLCERFRTRIDVPVWLENDANCAAVGEYLCGAGRGTKDFVIVTVGTGIGGGLILGGKLYTGAGMAGEIGHMVIRRDGRLCNCGRWGCWEAYASATGLIRSTEEGMASHPESLLQQKTRELGRVSGRTAFLAADAGDAAALEVCRNYVADLAAGVTNLINILQPEVLAIGGGVSNERSELLLDPLREIVERECYASHGGVLTKIVRAELGNDAGIIGAALLPKAQ